MSEEARIRILCVDDHPLLREAIAMLIKFQPDMILVGEATTGTEAIRKYREHGRTSRSWICDCPT
jgi:DNA-binding NarL/FixJ family response regulator